MHALHFRERISRYVNSIFFPIVVSLLAFLCWLCKTDFVWVFFPFYFISCFLPLFCDDGRGYLPLMFYLIIITNKDIHFVGGIPTVMILGIITFTISLIIYLIVRRPKFSVGSIFYSSIFLFVIFLISYLKSTIINGGSGRTGILYLLLFFILTCIHGIMNSVLGQGETMPYLAKTYCCFAIAASLETITALLIENSFELASPSFTLGWSYTRETVSTFLVLSLPFFSFLIHEKKPLWVIPAMLVVLSLIFLSTDSGLLCLIIFSIPLVFFTLKDYSVYSPYFIMFFLLLIGTVFGILMGVNPEFNSRIAKAALRINPFTDENKDIIKTFFDETIKNPVLGPSITSIVNNDGTLSLKNNTILSTLTMGGFCGLALYVVYEINLYRSFAQKKMKGKSIFLLFLLMIELIGLIDNTIYNIALLLVILLSLSVFRQSNRPDEILIHDDFFESKNEEYDRIRNQNTI